LLDKLRNEEFQRLKNGRQWEFLRPGDSIEIEKAPYQTSKETEVVKGVLIGKTNRLSDSMIRIINVSFA
jgi:hypothetical protein